MSKEEKIALLANELITNASESAKGQVEKAIKCGALNIDEWEEGRNQLIIPKIIAIAVIEENIDYLKGIRTGFEKEINKEVKNLKMFL
jgi:hypothetical protein